MAQRSRRTRGGAAPEVGLVADEHDGGATVRVVPEPQSHSVAFSNVAAYRAPIFTFSEWA